MAEHRITFGQITVTRTGLLWPFVWEWETTAKVEDITDPFTPPDRVYTKTLRGDAMTEKRALRNARLAQATMRIEDA